MNNYNYYNYFKVYFNESYTYRTCYTIRSYKFYTI